MTDHVATDQEIADFVREHMGIYRFLVSTSAGRFESNMGRVALDGSIRILPDPIRVATLEEIASKMRCDVSTCDQRAVALRHWPDYADTAKIIVGACRSHVRDGALWLVDPDAAETNVNECTQGCR